MLALPRPSRSSSVFLIGALLALSLGACQIDGGTLSMGDAALEHSVPRSASLPAGNAARVEIAAGAGSLRVEGVEGLTEIRAEGTARASDSTLLSDVQLATERQDDTVRLEARFPENMSGRTALDLRVEVPASLPLRISDGSGDVEGDSLAALRLSDGSGDLRLRGVAGRTEIDDGSGDLRLDGLGGPLRLTDGSGDVEARRLEAGATVRSDGSGDLRFEEVSGDVLVESDGSGDIYARRVKGSVRVASDGSGNIEVRDVAGDFIVKSAGSGDVRHQGVGGRVQVPAE